jgi:hypothetical protein
MIQGFIDFAFQLSTIDARKLLTQRAAADYFLQVL